MRRRLLFVMMLGISVAPPAFARETNYEPRKTGQIANVTDYSSESMKCGRMEAKNVQDSSDDVQVETIKKSTAGKAQ